MLSPKARSFLLAAHIAISGGWIGAVAAYLVFDVTVATTTDPQRLRASYLAMDAIADAALVPLALATLATGVLLGLGTRWGLFRHYWVVISLTMTVVATVVLLVETQTIGSLAATAADPSTTDEELRALPSTLVHSVGGLVILLIVLVLNVYKPRGLTPYGWRKQQAGDHQGDA